MRESILFSRSVLDTLTNVRCTDSHLLDQLEREASSARIDATISSGAAQLLFEQACRRSGVDEFGLLAGAWTQPAHYDLFAYYVLSQPTLGEVLRLTLRHLAAMLPGIRLELTQEDSLVGITSSDLRQNALWSRQREEFLVALLLRILRLATNARLEPVEVRFSHARARISTAHSDFFQAPIAVGQPRTELLIPKAWLPLPTKTADKQLREVMARHVEPVLRHMQTKAPLGQRVAELMQDWLVAGEEVSLARLAGVVGMPARTLQQRLHAQHTSFSLLWDAARRREATACLATGRMSVEQLAYHCQFEDKSSFYRAFRRWHGSTPTAWLQHGQRDVLRPRTQH